jgi:Putative Actinobacterial Holin-X, holin superfamily III
MAIDPDAPEVIGPRPKAERSLATLLSDLAAETILLIRQEVALFKAELGEKFSRAGKGATAVAVGALVAYSGWLALVAAMVLALSLALPAWLAAMVIGILIIAIGGGLALIGKSRLDARALVPRRTIRTLREDEEWLKDRLR